MLIKLYLYLSIILFINFFNEIDYANLPCKLNTITTDSIEEAYFLGQWHLNYSFEKVSGMKKYVYCHTCPIWEFNQNGLGAVRSFSDKLSTFTWSLSKPDTLFISGLELNSIDTFLYKLSVTKTNKFITNKLKLTWINSDDGHVLSKSSEYK